MADSKAEQEFQKWLDSQSGYIGKTAKANWWNDYNTNQGSQSRLGDVINGGIPDLNISGGSAKEQQGRVEGLERAKILTGQNPYQIGQDYQEAYGNIKKRTTGSDTGAELLRANKAGAVADARNQLQSQGVKGGAALGAVSAVERAKSYDVNNQIIDSQRKAEMDFMNAVKANANFTSQQEFAHGALAAGKDFKGAPQHSSGFGQMGTVICTQLYLSGYYPTAIYEADQLYGLKLMVERPHVYYGYRFLADPIVKLMQMSATFTHIVSWFALPWAENMAGKENKFGKFISKVGEPICGAIGKVILKWRIRYAD